MARDTPWRCSHCGTINEPNARACRECGKWPSLFDLQEPVEEAAPAARRTEVFEVEPFEPDVYEPAMEAEIPAPEELAGEDAEPRGRVPRWVITVIWALAIIIWIVANALIDSN